MSTYVSYFMVVSVAVFVVGFIGFYAYRLITARKKIVDDSAVRLVHVLRSSGLPVARGTDAPVGQLGAEASGPAGQPVGVAGADAEPAQGPSGMPSPAHVYERGPGIRGLTEAAVFMRRDKKGEVLFQIGEKPAMPLKFLLDAKSRSVLEQLSLRASADFGPSWAILASEDEDGRLTVTRLH